MIDHDARRRRAAVACAGLAALLATAGAAEPPVTAAGYVVLHQFEKPDGFGPFAELVQAADGTLYGTGYFGGAQDAGTVFSVKPTGKFAFAALHAFATTDGLAPATGLALGTDGDFYGLTAGGGAHGAGTAFRVGASGAFTTLHSFDAAREGSYPYLGRLVQAADGNFYGANQQGGPGGFGTVFRMTPAGQVSVLHAFAGGADDGATPRGGMVLAANGFLYGTTLCGGVARKTNGCGGTIYRVDPRDGHYNLVYRFSPADQPQAALTELDGVLYGTTSAGGDAHHGTIFKFELASHAYTLMHSFAGGVRATPPNADGAVPMGRLLVASDGNLYGTTSLGGANAAIDPNGDGIVFRITPAGAYTIVHSFGAATTDSARPYAGLVQGRDGNLYGVAHNGAYQSEGTIYRIALPAR